MGLHQGREKDELHDEQDQARGNGSEQHLHKTDLPLVLERPDSCIPTAAKATSGGSSSYLGDRIEQLGIIPPLPDPIRERALVSSAVP